MTTITKISGTVNADLPVLTKNYGIVSNTEEGVFLSELEKAGQILDTTGRTAVREFFDAGKRSGWLSKLLYVLPFVGNRAFPSAAAVPMIDRFHGYEPLTFGKSGEGLLEDVDFSAAIATSSSGNITGVKPWATDTCIVAPLTSYDLFAKCKGCANVGNGNYGVIWYGSIASWETGKTGRFAGAGTDTAAENYLGISTEGHFFQKLMGRDIRSADAGSAITAGGFHLLSEDIADRTYGKNITKYRLRAWTITTATEVADETAERDSVTSVPESLKSTRWGINAHWNNAANKVTHSLISTDIETRFLAWHDGTLDASDEATFLPALRKLLSAFGKLLITIAPPSTKA